MTMASAKVSTAKIGLLTAALLKAVAALNPENVDGMKHGLMQLASEIRDQAEESSNVIDFISEHPSAFRLVLASAQ